MLPLLWQLRLGVQPNTPQLAAGSFISKLEMGHWYCIHHRYPLCTAVFLAIVA